MARGGRGVQGRQGTERKQTPTRDVFTHGQALMYEPVILPA